VKVRLATTTYPGGSTEVLAYDADSNITRRCTRAGQPIAFTWDTLNRLGTKTLPGTAATCGATPAGTVVTYAYDRASRLTGVSDNSAALPAVAMPGNTTAYTIAYAYDATNRPTGVSFDPAPTPTLPATAASVTFSHGYNAANQRSSLAVIVPWLVAAGIGAIVGGTLDVGIQLVQSGGRVGEINWTSVGVAAASGALLPYLAWD
jgi:YD repeat-containing protein